MKINIGPYNTELIPVRSWERSYEYWRRPITCYLPEEEYTKYDKFVFGLFDKLSDFVLPLNRWSNNRKRQIKVHVDYYDIWNADYTLALIIAPVLKKLKEEKHGHPYVDNEDVPEELRAAPSEKEKQKHDGNIDINHEARWDWVLDEMIWTFEQHANDDDTEQFSHHPEQLDIILTPVEGMEFSSLTFNHQKDPSKPKYWRDEEGIKKHSERKQNGRRLFAKYYEALWV